MPFCPSAGRAHFLAVHRENTEKPGYVSPLRPFASLFQPGRSFSAERYCHPDCGTERSNKIRLHPGGSAGCLVSGKTWWSLKRTMLKGKIILRPGQVVRTFAGSGKPYRGGGGNPEGRRRRRFPDRSIRYALQRKTSSDPVPAPRGKCRRVRTALLGLEMILA